jgi:predicted dehydrogenase
MAKKIGVAVIGCGFIGAYHARAIMACKNAKLVGALSRTSASLKRFTQQIPVPFTTTDIEELAAHPDVDAVAIGTPNRLHAPQTILMLRAGKHVLLEKPMAMNASEGRKIARAAQDRGLRLQIGHNWRYDVEALYLKEVIRKGTLGKIVKTKGYGIHLNWGPQGWFTRKSEAGGGALIDMGVHAIDTVSFLLGDPAPVSVYAKIGTYYGSYDVDDTGVMMIEWENGVVSMIESGWWHPHMDGLEASTQVYGTRGYAQILPTELKISVGSMPGTFRPEFHTRDDHCEQAMYDRQMDAFVRSVLQGTPPHPDGEHGVTIMRILDACYRSAQTGKAITLG